VPWIRIDEHAMDHPKIVGLTDAAFRLWVYGLAYCQHYLTDGRIDNPKVLRGFTPAKRTALLDAGLWVTAGNAVTVHDYLDWNDSRETVLGKRDAAKNRMRRSRDVPANNGSNTARTSERTSSDVLSGVVCSSPPKLVVKEGGVGETAPDDSIKARAGAFAEWYAAAHERILGTAYLGPYRDYEHAQRLCEKFPDADLQHAAIVWFGMEDDFAASGTRTMAKFASRATKCVEIARKVVA
jgi:hypothetical protein